MQIFKADPPFSVTTPWMQPGSWVLTMILWVANNRIYSSPQENRSRWPAGIRYSCRNH